MSGINATEFERGTSTAAKTFAKNANINVVFTGEKAYTQGSTIVLPAIDEAAEISPQDAAIIRGYTDHEFVHQLITDMKAGESIRKGKDAYLDTLMQCVEDVRVDVAGGQMYYGTKANLEHVCNAVYDEMHNAMAADPKLAKDFKAIAPHAMVLAGRMKAGLDIDKGEAILDMLDPQDRAIIDEIAERAVNLPTGVTGPGEVDKHAAYKGFADAMKLAQDAKDIFMEHEERREGGDSEGEGEGESGRGGGNDSDGTGDESESDRPAGEGNAASGDIDPFANAMLERLFKKKNYAPAKGARYRRPPLVNDEIVDKDSRDKLLSWVGARTPDQQRSMMDAFHKRYIASLATAGNVLSVMKARLERSLMALDKGGREECQGSGRLNRRRLIDAVRGRSNIYTRKSDDFDLNTAVQVVVDMSGSMSGSKIDLARQSTIILAEALQKCGVPFEVCGFYTHDTIDYDALGLDMKNFSRWDCIRFIRYKRFDDRLQNVTGLIGGMYAAGANADSESLLYAWESLAKRHERRRIMIVLSDGSPSFYTDENEEVIYQHTRDVVQMISKKADVLGIGIMDDSVKEFYPNHVVIDNVAQLPTVMLDKLARMMTGKSLV